MTEHNPFPDENQVETQPAAASTAVQEPGVATYRDPPPTPEGEDIVWLMSRAQGRRFMWRLLQRARPWDPSFDPTTPEATHYAARRDGVKEFVSHLHGLVHDLCLDDYVRMVKENRNGSGDDH